MRLTLRTLLAYMDDILDPADHEELGRKIESSDFATELIHRSRDTVRRLRLSAPDPLGGGDSDDVLGADPHLDANTVAEYLDNTLPPDDVAEFERRCLDTGNESDMLLAEATSCHHILTMVLGEPAEVDADLRQRIYQMGETAGAQQAPVEQAHPQPVAAEQPSAEQAAAVAPEVAPAAEPLPHEREVPDYLRAAADQQRRGRRRSVIAVLAACLAGVAAWVFWPAGEVEVPPELANQGGVSEDFAGGLDIGAMGDGLEVQEGLGADAPAPVDGGEAPAFVPGAVATSDVPGAAPQESPAEPAAVAPAVGVDAEDFIGRNAIVSDAAPEPEVTLDLQEEAAVDRAPPFDLGGDGVGGDSPMSDASPDQIFGQADDVAADPDRYGDLSGGAPAGPLLSGSVPSGPVPPEPTPSLSGPSLEDLADAAPREEEAMPEIADATDAGEVEADEVEIQETPAPVQPPGPQRIGTYLGNDDLVLIHNTQSDQWLRLPANRPLTEGDHLISFPTYRSHVILKDMNVLLTGGTQINLLGVDDDIAAASDFGVEVSHGKLILSSGLNGNEFDLVAGDIQRTLKLGPSSSLAVDVQRVYVPGSNPETEVAPTVIDWYLTSGSVEVITELSAENIEAPATWQTSGVNDSKPVAAVEMPPWIASEPVNELQRSARRRIAEALSPGRSVMIPLLEYADRDALGRRREDRTLATQAGAHVGLFEPFVRALNDEDQRAYWDSMITLMRESVAARPGAAGKLREAFVSIRGPQAAGDLMELVLGYSAADVGTTPEQIRTGALLRLLQWMDSDQLDYRVLASYNVTDITGMSGYRPTQTSSQRSRSLRRYADRLENGELRPK